MLSNESYSLLHWKGIRVTTALPYIIIPSLNSHEDVIPFLDTAERFFPLIDLVEAVTEHIGHHHLERRQRNSHEKGKTQNRLLQSIEASLLHPPGKLTRSAGTSVCSDKA